MMHVSRARSLAFTFLACALSACSGSSSDDGTTVSLAVTDAAADELSTFTIGLESVELMSATGAPVSLLQIPTAVDFVALTDLSRVLNIAAIEPDTYTGVEVTLLFDGDRVHVNGENQPATLVDSSDNPLTGTLTLPIDFPTPLDVTTGNYVIELDLDLSQSADVDAGNNKVVFEPTIVPRVNRNDAKEHAVGGDLRTVVLAKSLFRVALEAPIGVAQPVVEVATGPGTVFQIDGVSMLGAAGLSALGQLPLGSWVQGFGSVDASSRRFQAATVEAGSGSYNGGTDIVEGVIIDRAGGAGTDTTLTIRGHSNNADHTTLNFNLDFVVNTSFANTKVVRRGSATPFDTDDLNIGQKVRMFGALTIGPPNVLDVTTATDVVRMEPTWVFGTANEVPETANPDELEIDLQRVDLRDVGLFDWGDGGLTPPTPTAFRVGDPINLSGGQGITVGTPIVALGFFAPVDDTDADLAAGVLANRELLPSLLLIRDRVNGTIVTTDTSGTSIDYTFDVTNPPVTFEKAVIDMGFAGETDVTGTGISIVKENLLGLGIYVIYDRTLVETSMFFTFDSFYQALDTKLLGGAQLFNVGALGVYDSVNDEMPSALVGVTVQ